MSVDVKVWSDFVCPFCMIAEHPLRQAIQDSGVEVDIDWMPFELRPYPTPTLRPEDHYLQSVWPQSVYPIAEKYGVKIKLPSVSPQPYTALAWEGYQFAREQARGTEYNDRVLGAFFQQDQDIGDPEVLTRLATEIGLDEAEFGAALKQRRYRDAHQRALAQAQAMGVTAVPTFMIGGRFLPGVQPPQVLTSALHAAARAAGNNP